MTDAVDDSICIDCGKLRKGSGPGGRSGAHGRCHPCYRRLWRKNRREGVPMPESARFAAKDPAKPGEKKCIDCPAPVTNKGAQGRCPRCDKAWRKTYTDRGETPPKADPNSRRTKFVAPEADQPMCATPGCGAAVDVECRGLCHRCYGRLRSQAAARGEVLPPLPRKKKPVFMPYADRAPDPTATPRDDGRCLEAGCSHKVGKHGNYGRCRDCVRLLREWYRDRDLELPPEFQVRRTRTARPKASPSNPPQPRPNEWVALASGLCNEAGGCPNKVGRHGGRGKCPKHFKWWKLQYEHAEMDMPKAERNQKRKSARKKTKPKVDRPCVEENCPNFVGRGGAWDRCPTHYRQFMKWYDDRGLPRPTREGGRDPRCTWPSDETLLADMKELGSIKKVADKYERSDSSLRNFLSVPRRRWLRLEMDKYRKEGRGWPRNPVTGKKWNTHGKASSEYDRRTKNKPTAQAYEYAELIIGEPCSHCGAIGDTIDHILALSKNGTSEWDNLAIACHSCNSRKNNKSLLGFMLDSMDDLDWRRTEREREQREAVSVKYVVKASETDVVSPCGQLRFALE